MLMPIPTPFHSRTAPLCTTYEWRDWAGYLAPALYEPAHDREYYAIRNAAALIDVSPLFKYEISGPDALRAVDRIITRDATKCQLGQVLYTPWCDEDGQVIDDGTVARLAEDRFRITAADPNLRWFQDVADGFDAHVEDVSTSLAALSLQGPNSREILRGVLGGTDLDALRYFHLAHATLDDIPLTVTRTGYTGDLGYELWIPAGHALALWDRLVDHGQAYGLLPTGMVAMDIARIEAGLLLIEVDYKSSAHAQIEAQKSSPYELGFGWTVELDVGDFVGRDALRAEKARGSEWAFVGVEVSWTGIEKLFAEEDLPPQVAGRASRQAIPLYCNGRQVGQLTSHTFSPILKRYIGIGHVLTDHAAPGTPLDAEITVEYRRKTAPGTVVPTPFYDPAHKRR
jgi:aminomethyltransferase